MPLMKVGDNSMMLAATEALQNTSVGSISVRAAMSSAINGQKRSLQHKTCTGIEYHFTSSYFEFP